VHRGVSMPIVKWTGQFICTTATIIIVGHFFSTSVAAAIATRVLHYRLCLLVACFENTATGPPSITSECGKETGDDDDDDDKYYYCD
jgi:hypothetical protein